MNLYIQFFKSRDEFLKQMFAIVKDSRNLSQCPKGNENLATSSLHWRLQPPSTFQEFLLVLTAEVKAI